MSDTIYMIFCDQCQEMTEIEVTSDEFLDGKAISGGHVCARCGRSFGIWMDGGKLDLGLVRESVTHDDNNFEVFPQEPWRT